MIGKSTLIVIDGLDGSGKSTITPLVYEHFKKKSDKVVLISYPDYDSKSSALVKMYLNGELSKNADEINPFAASSFYAVDRYASFKQHWESYYNEGFLIIATRYVTSNAIHQMSKLDKTRWDEFLAWLDDYEYEKLALPRPDKVFFLDMPREVANALITSRYDGDDNKKDIHEKNKEYMAACEKSAYYAADKLGFKIIPCAFSQSNEKRPRAIEEITSEVIKEIEKMGL